MYEKINHDIWGLICFEMCVLPLNLRVYLEEGFGFLDNIFSYSFIHSFCLLEISYSSIDLSFLIVMFFLDVEIILRGFQSNTDCTANKSWAFSTLRSELFCFVDKKWAYSVWVNVRLVSVLPQTVVRKSVQFSVPKSQTGQFCLQNIKL